MGFRVKFGDSNGAAECAISVGEHVWVLGREGEYVVMGVDRTNGRLQVLRLGSKSGMESVPLWSVRAVLAPKGGEAHESAA